MLLHYPCIEHRSPPDLSHPRLANSSGPVVGSEQRYFWEWRPAPLLNCGLWPREFLLICAPSLFAGRHVADGVLAPLRTSQLSKAQSDAAQPIQEDPAKKASALNQSQSQLTTSNGIL